MRRCGPQRLPLQSLLNPSDEIKSKREEVNWARQDGPSNPLSAFDKHLETYRPLTRQTFIMHLNKVAKAAGLDPIHSHGIRIGAMLEYLLRGIPFDVMKVKGWWASNTFQLYL